jgi:hypothetical protein
MEKTRRVYERQKQRKMPFSNRGGRDRREDAGAVPFLAEEVRDMSNQRAGIRRVSEMARLLEWRGGEGGPAGLVKVKWKDQKRRREPETT